jgi:hypothetical protein
MSINKPIAKPSNNQAVFLRRLVVWVIFIFADVLHGTARIFWLEPLIGDVKARQNFCIHRIGNYFGDRLNADICLIKIDF